MKKILSLVVLATASMSVCAQNATYTELGYASIEGINADAVVEVAAGTALGSDAAGNTYATAFADQCKLVGVQASNYSIIKVNGVENSIKGGYQGNNNAKDADGGNPANTLKVPTQGSSLKIVANADGYIYVVGKFSQNKQYVVFEGDDTNGYYPIGYTIVCDGTASGQAATALTAEVKGDDADFQYWVTNPIAKLGAINGAGDDAAKNGAGFIKFQAYSGSEYYVNATGSKLTQCGVIFSETGTEDIVLAGVADEEAGTPAPTEIILESSTSAVAGVAEAVEAKAAPIKVMTANGIQIGNYNIAGQQVK